MLCSNLLDADSFVEVISYILNEFWAAWVLQGYYPIKNIKIPVLFTVPCRVVVCDDVNWMPPVGDDEWSLLLNVSALNAGSPEDWASAVLYDLTYV